MLKRICFNIIAAVLLISLFPALASSMPSDQAQKVFDLQVTDLTSQTLSRELYKSKIRKILSYHQLFSGKDYYSTFLGSYTLEISNNPAAQTPYIELYYVSSPEMLNGVILLATRKKVYIAPKLSTDDLVHGVSEPDVNPFVPEELFVYLKGLASVDSKSKKLNLQATGLKLIHEIIPRTL